MEFLVGISQRRKRGVLSHLDRRDVALLHFGDGPKLRGVADGVNFFALSTNSPVVPLRSMMTPSIGALISSCLPSSSGDSTKSHHGPPLRGRSGRS